MFLFLHSCLTDTKSSPIYTRDSARQLFGEELCVLGGRPKVDCIGVTKVEAYCLLSSPKKTRSTCQIELQGKNASKININSRTNNLFEEKERFIKEQTKKNNRYK